VTHPIIETRKRLITLFQTQLKAAGFGEVDVFDWYNAAYAETAAVVLGEAQGDIERDRFSTATRVPFAESWSINVAVTLTTESTVETDRADYAMAVADVLVTALAKDPRLSAQPSLVICTAGSMSLSADVENEGLVVEIQLIAEYRVDRSRV